MFNLLNFPSSAKFVGWANVHLFFIRVYRCSSAIKKDGSFGSSFARGTIKLELSQLRRF